MTRENMACLEGYRKFSMAVAWERRGKASGEAFVSKDQALKCFVNHTNGCILFPQRSGDH